MSVVKVNESVNGALWSKGKSAAGSWHKCLLKRCILLLDFLLFMIQFKVYAETE